MAKFKVLKHNQELMALLGIHSHRLTEPTNEFFKLPVTYLVLFILCTFSITSCAMFAYKNFSQFGAALEAIYIMIAGVQCGGMYLSVGLKMKQVKLLQQKLQEIVDEGHTFDVAELYWNTERKCRQYTKTMVYSYVMFIEGLLLTKFVQSIYFVFLANSDPTSIALPYYMVVPFDTTTLCGWYLLWFIQCVMSFNYSMGVISTTSFFLCCCIYIDSIRKHMELIFASLKQNIDQIRQVKKRTAYHKLRRDIQENLHQAIDLHVKVIDIFRMVADINGGTIFSLLPVNAVFLAISMYRMENLELNLISFAQDILYIVSSLCWPYVFCRFATHVTDQMVSIGRIAYEVNWYDSPVVWQKYLILIISRSQQKVYFTGFNLITCTLETFAKVTFSLVQIR
ncbi:odorant receptor 67a-like [Sitodiplosis mosellana]|uniref:odorant receptor 67a-like n=1 Tax=Sitodiplosis mosellana TaxID=263140 RepID=UPI002443B1DD|nr:odorant receptor 67a-like [Sitodiplosis mosellana]